jgi:hypothetical protein
VPEAILNTGYCFACWPSGPVTPPPRLLCGSLDYYNTGKCRRCHLYGAPPVESCPDCLAWGTVRKWQWLCQACHGWQKIYTERGACSTCGTVAHLHTEHGICRLRFAQARNMIPLLGRFDPVEANRHGQQLFLAGWKYKKGSSRTAARAEQRARTAPSTVTVNVRREIKALLEQPLPFAPRHTSVGEYTIASRYEQPSLFPAHREFAGLRQKDFPWPKDTAFLYRLWKLADERSVRLGWSAPVRMRCRAGLRIVLGLQDNPGDKVPLTSLEFLTEII